MSNGTICVNPHITQYTVYITDNSTGNTVTENVTETHFSFNTLNDGSCPIYQVSAWNAGGEGELSEPVWDSTLQGKRGLSRPSHQLLTVALSLSQFLTELQLRMSLLHTQ